MWLPVIGVWSHVDAAGKPDIQDLWEDPRRKPFFSSPTGRRLQLEEGIHILLQVSSCCALFINNHQSSCDRRPEIYEADLSPVLPRWCVACQHSSGYLSNWITIIWLCWEIASWSLTYIGRIRLWWLGPVVSQNCVPATVVDGRNRDPTSELKAFWLADPWLNLPPGVCLNLRCTVQSRTRWRWIHFKLRILKWNKDFVSSFFLNL